MTVEGNKALVRKHFEQVWNGGDANAVTETLAPGYVGHDPNTATPVQGPEGYLTATAAFRAAFPDARFTIEELFGEGDRVVARLTLRATHTISWHGAAPTGHPIAVDGVIIYRLTGGKIAESWGLWNLHGLMKQIGQEAARDGVAT
jgi:steroid delta-isomerase-like uncharacterized protein